MTRSIPARHGRRRGGKTLPVWPGLLLALAMAPPVQAARVAGPEGNADRQVRQANAAPADPGAAAGTMALASGVLGQVDAAAQRVTLNGHPVLLHPTGLRVLSSQGQPLGGVAALRSGMVVRFALEPAGGRAEAERRIVLIYVDRQP